MATSDLIDVARCPICGAKPSVEYTSDKERADFPWTAKCSLSPNHHLAIGITEADALLGFMDHWAAREILWLKAKVKVLESKAPR